MRDFQKNEYFGGYEDFVDITLGSSQKWIIFTRGVQYVMKPGIHGLHAS